MGYSPWGSRVRLHLASKQQHSIIHRKKETSKEKTSIIASVKSESKTSSENDVYILFMIIKLQNYE